MISVRGAITVENNDKNEILNATEDLLTQIIDRNNIKIDQISNIIFTTTKDLDQAYPAVAARNIGVLDAALMCVQEMFVEKSLEKCIRIMLQCESELSQKEVHHVYLNKAKILRPDLAE